MSWARPGGVSAGPREQKRGWASLSGPVRHRDGPLGPKGYEVEIFLFVLFFLFISKPFQNSLNQFENILSLLKFTQ